MHAPSQTGLSDSPYPGLRPFRRDEADIFFGREEQVDQLLAKLESSRFLAVVGVSGCGKSSLVRAGMLSALAGGFMASAGPRWHVIEMRPGGHPLANLAQALLRGDTLDGEWRSRPDAEAFIRAILRRGPLGLAELLGESLAPSRNNLLLLVDQFEEIFRFHKHGDANEATAFVDLLLESARQQDVPIFVVLTMRSDFLGDCSLFAGLPEAINAGQFLIPRLTREQCRAAVAGPAAAFGAEVEPELVNHVLNDIGSNPDQLPLMQHALMRVWNRAGKKVSGPVVGQDSDLVGQNSTRSESCPTTGPDTFFSDQLDGELTLTLAEYQAVGGLKHALSNHADELYESLAAEDRRIAEVLLRCLSERGGDGRDIRRPVRLAAAAEVAQAPAEAIVRIVEVFREPTCSFLTPPAPVPLDADTVLDISHESLIRQWRRMAAWVEAEASSAAIYRRLADTAGLWQAGQAALWDTPDLENALCWREREQPNAAWAQRYGGRFAESIAFLDASVAAHERLERAEKERQERERELLQNMARAEKQRADEAEARRREQARANRGLRRRAVAALVASITAAGLAAAAFLLFLNARVEKQRADEARAEAETAKHTAEQLAANEAAARTQSQKAEAKALEASNAAFRNLARANFAQLLSLPVASEPGRQAKAFELLRETAELRNTALDLAKRQEPAERETTERYWRERTPLLRDEAVRWLSRTSLQPIQKTLFPAGFANGHTVTATGDLERLASLEVQGAKRSLQIRSRLTGAILASKELEGNRFPFALAFSGDGTRLLVASREAAGPNQVFHVDQHSAADLAKSKSTTLQAEGMPRFWQGNESFWFNAAGTRFFLAIPTGYAGSGTMVWDLATGKPLFADKAVRAIAQMDADDRLVTIDAKNTVRLVDLPKGTVARQFSLPGISVPQMPGFVSPDDKWLLVHQLPHYQGTAYVYPLVIINLLTGEKAAECKLMPSTNVYATAFKAAFHPKHPVVAVTNGSDLWLVSIPGGGILYQAPLGESAPGNVRSILVQQVQFSRQGDALLTVVPEMANPAHMVAQSWDAAFASASRQTAWNESVNDFHFTSDDALAIAGAASAPTGVQVHSLQGSGHWRSPAPQPGVTVGGFDPSGQRFVYALPDRCDVYDAANGKRLASIPRTWPMAGYHFTLPVDQEYRWIVGVEQDGAVSRLRLFDVIKGTWTATLLDAASQLQSVQFDNQFRHVSVGAIAPSAGKGPGRFSTTVYRIADGSKVREVVQPISFARVTQSGYLISSTYGKITLRAHELAGDGRSIESALHPPSNQYWLDRNERTAAFAVQQGLRQQVAVWPFADEKQAKVLPFECQFLSTIALLPNRLLLTADVTPATKATKSTKRQYAVELWDLKTEKALRSRTSEQHWTLLLSEPTGKAIVYQLTQPTTPCEVWDVNSGEVLQTVAGDFRSISPDKRFVCFSGGRLLDLASMKMRTFAAPADTYAARFSPDSRYLILTSTGARRESHLRVLDVHDPAVAWTPAEAFLQLSIDVSPDSRLLGFVDAHRADLLHVYALATGKKMQSISLRGGSYRPDQLPRNNFAKVWFAPGGKHVAALVAGHLRLANTDGAQAHTTLARSGSHQSPVYAVAAGPDGRFLASAGADGTVCFWRTRDGRHLGGLEEGGAGVDANIRRLLFSPRGNLLALRKQGGEIAVWKWSDPENADADIAATFLWSNARDEGPVQSAGGKVVLKLDSALTVADAKGTVRPAAFARTHKFKMVPGYAYTIEMLSPDSKRLDPFLRLEDPQGAMLMENDDIVPTVNVNSRILFEPARAGEYRIIATSFAAEQTGPYTLVIHQAARAAGNADVPMAAVGHRGGALAFSRDGTLLAAADANGSIRLFQADSGRLVHWLKPLATRATVHALAFSADGAHLAAARGPLVALWAIEAGSLGRAWDAQQGPIHALAYSGDGRFLVTSGRDMRVWDSATGDLLLTLEKQASAVRHATFSPSGRRLAALVDDRSVVVTDVAELIAAIHKIGLQASADKAPRADSGPLWAPQSEEKLVQENLIVALLPKVATAERAKDWQEAVAQLTRLLDIEPDNKSWRLRRAAANEQLKDWPAVAVDRSYALDNWPHDLYRDAAQTLQKWFREQPELFAALEKLRTKDRLIPFTRGREMALQSKWREAQAAYGSVIKQIPAGEEWYHYAAICLLSGDRKAAHDHITWMAQQQGQPMNDNMAHCYARAAGLVADPRCSAEALAWADAAIAKQRPPWHLNAAGLVYYRAGQLDKARATLNEALKGAWYCQALNELALGMVEHKLGNDKAARDLLDAARKWEHAAQSRRKNGYTDVQLPDWVELYVLLPELEAMVANAPAK